MSKELRVLESVYRLYVPANALYAINAKCHLLFTSRIRAKFICLNVSIV